MFFYFSDLIDTFNSKLPVLGLQWKRCAATGYVMGCSVLSGGFQFYW